MYILKNNVFVDIVNNSRVVNNNFFFITKVKKFKFNQILFIIVINDVVINNRFV